MVLQENSYVKILKFDFDFVYQLKIFIFLLVRFVRFSYDFM